MEWKYPYIFNPYGDVVSNGLHALCGHQLVWEVSDIRRRQMKPVTQMKAIMNAFIQASMNAKASRRHRHRMRLLYTGRL